MKGLVLEGGGSRGAYQIGAYKALLEAGYNFDGICGTSIGALNGALLAQGDLDKAYHLWENIKPASLFGIPQKTWDALILRKLNIHELPDMIKTLHNIVTKKGVSTKNIKALLEDIIDENAIRNSSIDFGFLVFNITDNKALEYFKEDVPKGKMADYILSSANLPIFQLEKIDGKILIDGGVYDNLPVKLIAKKGYKDLVVIRTFAMGKKQNFNRNALKILWIEPSEDLGNILDFSPDHSKYLLKLGYYDVQRNLLSLKGVKYYIKPKNDETFYKDFFEKLSKIDLTLMEKSLGVEGVPPYRFIFEHLIPLLSDSLGLSNKSSYEDIMIGIAEWMSVKLELNRFKVYDIKNLFNSIFTHPKAKKLFVHDKKIPSLAMKNEIIANLFKENILNEFCSFCIQIDLFYDY